MKYWEVYNNKYYNWTKGSIKTHSFHTLIIHDFNKYLLGCGTSTKLYILPRKVEKEKVEKSQFVWVSVYYVNNLVTKIYKKLANVNDFSF